MRYYQVTLEFYLDLDLDFPVPSFEEQLDEIPHRIRYNRFPNFVVTIAT